jgi:hypothetical protein
MNLEQDIAKRVNIKLAGIIGETMLGKVTEGAGRRGAEAAERVGGGFIGLLGGGLGLGALGGLVGGPLGAGIGALIGGVGGARGAAEISSSRGRFDRNIKARYGDIIAENAEKGLADKLTGYEKDLIGDMIYGVPEGEVQLLKAINKIPIPRHEFKPGELEAAMSPHGNLYGERLGASAGILDNPITNINLKETSPNIETLKKYFPLDLAELISQQGIMSPFNAAREVGGMDLIKREGLDLLTAPVRNIPKILQAFAS